MGGVGSCTDRRVSQVTLRVLSDAALFLNNIKNRTSCDRRPSLTSLPSQHILLSESRLKVGVGKEAAASESKICTCLHLTPIFYRFPLLCADHGEGGRGWALWLTERERSQPVNSPLRECEAVKTI